VTLLDADLALYRRVARSDTPLLDATLPRLSHAANHSKLWIGCAGLLASLGGRRGRRAALRGLGSIAITATLVNGPLKLAFRRARPTLKGVPELRRLRRMPVTTSFPSGHSASAAAFAVAAGLELPALAVPLGAAAAAVAFSRVYTGVHYPGDVAAGVATGAAVALLTRRVWPVAPHSAGDVSPSREMVELAPGDDGEGLTIVVNAEAGPAWRPDPLTDLREALPRAEVVEIEDGSRLEAAAERAAAGCRVLGVCGGDGSANAAAQAAVRHDRPLLVIPGGTLNHLGRDLGLFTAEDALEAYRAGEAVRMDIGRIDGRPFLNTASFGAYPEMVAMRELLEARIGKWPALAIALVRILRRSQPIEVTLDGKRRSLWMIFIGNCRYHPDGFAPSWRERLDDGMLDIRIVAGDQPFARVRLVGALASGTLGRCRAYVQTTGHDLEVDSGGTALRLARDGEVFQSPGRFMVEKDRSALTVYARQR
jgi:undecaprenyl-diphosphatase